MLKSLPIVINRGSRLDAEIMRLAAGPETGEALDLYFRYRVRPYKSHNM